MPASTPDHVIPCHIPTPPASGVQLAASCGGGGEHPPESTLAAAVAATQATYGADKAALAIVRAHVLASARSLLVYLDDVEAATSEAVQAIVEEVVGSPRPGESQTRVFLDNVVRFYADARFERTSRAQHEAYDPPAGRRSAKER